MHIYLIRVQLLKAREIPEPAIHELAQVPRPDPGDPQELHALRRRKARLFPAAGRRQEPPTPEPQAPRGGGDGAGEQGRRRRGEGRGTRAEDG